MFCCLTHYSTNKTTVICRKVEVIGPPAMSPPGGSTSVHLAQGHNYRSQFLGLQRNLLVSLESVLTVQQTP